MKKLTTLLVLNLLVSLSANALQLGCKNTNSSVAIEGNNVSVVHNGKVFLDAPISEQTILDDGSRLILTRQSEDKPDVSGGTAKFRITAKLDSDNVITALKVEANEGLQSLFKWYPVLSCSNSDIRIYSK